VARKYIERNDTLHDSSDESKHSGRAKIDIQDATDIQDRSITFSKHERPLTPTEATQVMAKELTGAVQDTGQYIEDVKTHINKQMSTINKIKAQKEEFDRELELLQFGSQQPKTNSSVDEMKKIRLELVEKKKLEETSLARLNNHIMITKKQVDQYQVLIDEVDGKLKKVQPQTPKLTDADKQLIAKILSSARDRKQNDPELSRTINQLAANLAQSVEP
jgi:chromosome segregation ATPase